MMAAILNSATLNLAILDSAILVFSFKLTNTCQDWFPPFAKKFHSFILTQLDDGSHLEFCHLEFGYLGFSHLSIFFQTDSHLPRLVPAICTKTFTHSIWLNFMIAAILNSAILNLAILYSAILIFSFKLTHTCQDWFQPFSQNISLIHSDSTSWLQPSWLPPCWIQPLPSWIQTPCYLLSDSLKYTLNPLWLWLKLIQSDLNSFILT